LSEHKNLILAFAITLPLVAIVGYLLSTKTTVEKEMAKLDYRKVDRDQWLRGIYELTPMSFCGHQSYFQGCFKIDQTTCLKQSLETGAKCLKNLRSGMPKILRLPKDGIYWGRKISFCIISELQKEFANKKHKAKDNCEHPGKWSKANPTPTITKAHFMIQLEQDLPEKVCSENSPVRRCFLIDEDQCYKSATDFANDCLLKFEDKIPGILHQPQESYLWGNKIGACVGENFRQKLANEMLPSCKAM